ncbi:MAG: polysaccharide biosynthesis/export family protein [Bryobacteraceae bacterium]
MRFTAYSLAFTILSATLCFSQKPPLPPIPNSENGFSNLPAQKIGPNDLIAVSVYDSQEMTRSVRVSAEGMIRLPMVKKQIKAEGLMPSELENAIASELKAEELLVEPVVTVTMMEYHSHPISVAGAVKNPVTFQATTPVTLLDAITRAGGLAPDAGLEILVSRTKKVAGEEKPLVLTQRIPVRGLINAADPELNILLVGGEEIRVPEIGKVFVVGQVKKPGAFPIQDSSETTVLQMLALAEGLQGISNDQAFIYRREASGSKNEIPVNLKSIMARKSPDVPLIANDIFYIPENHGKKMGLAALEKVLLFGTSAGATALAYGMIR